MGVAEFWAISLRIFNVRQVPPQEGRERALEAMSTRECGLHVEMWRTTETHAFSD